MSGQRRLLRERWFGSVLAPWKGALVGALVVVWCLPLRVSAQTITTTSAAGANAETLIPGFDQQLQDGLNSALALTSLGSFVKELSNTQMLSVRGLERDLASNPDLFVISGGAGLALTASNDTIKDNNPIPGLFVNASVMAGLNLSFIEWPELTVYASAFHFGTSIGDLNATLTNFSVSAVYKLFGPVGWSWLLKWGGLDLGAGFGMAKFKLSLNNELPLEVPLTDSSQGSVTASTKATGEYSFGSTAFAIPLTVSTNLQLFYLLTLYGGAGVDFKFGSGSFDVALDANDIQATVGTETVSLGGRRIEASQGGGPPAVDVRPFIGVQINAWLAKLFGEVHISTPNLGVAIAVGARVVW